MLRLPKSTQAIVSVPTQAMLSGNLTAYDGTTVPANLINPFSLKLAALSGRRQTTDRPERSPITSWWIIKLPSTARRPIFGWIR